MQNLSENLTSIPFLLSLAVFLLALIVWIFRGTLLTSKKKLIRIIALSIRWQLFVGLIVIIVFSVFVKWDATLFGFTPGKEKTETFNTKYVDTTDTATVVDKIANDSDGVGDEKGEIAAVTDNSEKIAGRSNTNDKDEVSDSDIKVNKFLFLGFLLALNACIISFAKALKNSLNFDKYREDDATYKKKNDRHKDSINFWYQNIFVFFVGVAIVEVMLILEVNSDNFIAYALVAALCGWIFQDIIKGILAYYHMRSLGVLHIGDWIQVPGKGIDGTIADFSLVNVKVENWDGTHSSLPTSALQTEYMVNNQNMLEGRTSGRRMLKTFLIDTTTIRCLSQEEVERLKQRSASEGVLPVAFDRMETPTLNLQMFRLYINEWLNNCPLVTHNPRLIVRLQEQTPTGYPLQVYIFLLNTRLAAYEQDQSYIIEHILSSMKWFGLELYQAATSATDVTIVNK